MTRATGSVEVVKRIFTIGCDNCSEADVGWRPYWLRTVVSSYCTHFTPLLNVEQIQYDISQCSQYIGMEGNVCEQTNNLYTPVQNSTTSKHQ